MAGSRWGIVSQGVSALAGLGGIAVGLWGSFVSNTMSNGAKKLADTLERALPPSSNSSAIILEKTRNLAEGAYTESRVLGYGVITALALYVVPDFLRGLNQGPSISVSFSVVCAQWDYVAGRAFHGAGLGLTGGAIHQAGAGNPQVASALGSAGMVSLGVGNYFFNRNAQRQQPPQDGVEDVLLGNQRGAPSSEGRSGPGPGYGNV